MHGKSRRASERTEAHIRRTPCSRTPRIFQRTPHTRVQSACAKPPCAARTIQSVYPRRTLPAVLTSTATLFALSRNRTHQPKPDTPQIPHESHTPAAPVFSPRILPPRPIPLPRPPSAGMRIRNIDKKASLCYNTERADKSAFARRSHNTDGIWCNGNTRDFDSRFAGSSPAIPAINPSGGKSRSVIRAAGKRENSRDFSRFFDPEFLRNFIDPFCPFRCCVRTRTHEKGFLRLPKSNRFCGELRICEGGGQRKKSCVRKNPGM